MSQLTSQVLNDIAIGLEAVLPDLGGVDSLSFLTMGSNSVVVESRSGHVFRIGRNRRSFWSYQKESTLLPIISDMVDIAIPVPDCLVNPAPTMPYGAIGYKKLPGRPLSDAKNVDRRQIADQQ